MNTSGILKDATGRNWLRFINAEIRYGAFVARFETLEMPTEARQILSDHERYISQQVLTHLDEFDRKMNNYRLSIVWDGEREPLSVCDVQVMDSELSFRLKGSNVSNK